MAVGHYDCQRRADGEALFRHFHASDRFVRLLRQRGIPAKRSKVQPILIAEVALSHGPVGLATLLERIALRNAQSQLFLEPNPAAGGEFMMPTPVERILQIEETMTMRHWPPFDVWYSDLLYIAYSWNISRQVVESVPSDWYESCWRRQWPPYDALYSMLVDVGMMNEEGQFEL